MGARYRAGRRERRGDARLEFSIADRTPTDAANSGKPQHGRDTVRRKPTRPISPADAQTGRDLRNLRRTFAEQRAPVLRRCLPGERQQLEIAFVASGVAALAKMRAEGREPMDSAEVRRKLGEATAQRDARKSNGIEPTTSRTRRIQARGPAAAQGCVAAEDEGGDGAVVNECGRVRRGADSDRDIGEKLARPRRGQRPLRAAHVPFRLSCDGDSVHPVGNLLYYGDNLDILRRDVADESVDLIYLDPPFNSNATYNVLFAEQGGAQAAS